MSIIVRTAAIVLLAYLGQRFGFITTGGEFACMVWAVALSPLLIDAVRSSWHETRAR